MHILSFPRSAWERPPLTALRCEKPGIRLGHFIDGTRSVPTVRAHAERGHEGRGARHAS